jgi:hypothetical protein
MSAFVPTFINNGAVMDRPNIKASPVDKLGSSSSSAWLIMSDVRAMKR